MLLTEAFPDATAIMALEPDELGLQLMAVLARRPPQTLQSLVRELGLRDGRPGAFAGQGVTPNDLRVAFIEAWSWLEGAGLLVPTLEATDPNQHPSRMLSRKAMKLSESADPRSTYASRRVTKESLHPVIREDVWALFHRGKFDTAVFEAMKALEIAVRNTAGFDPGDHGVAMMHRAFNPDGGPLTDMSLLKPERQSIASLFAGAIGTYRNSFAHREVGLDDPDEAAELIYLASHLLRIVTRRQKAREPTDDG